MAAAIQNAAAIFIKETMKTIIYLAIALSLLLTGCSSEPTLQKFFVENSQKKDFIALDLTSDLFEIGETTLTPEQATALKSFEKMNIIAFKATPANQAEYQLEKEKLKTILKDKEYQELMKFGSGEAGASVSFVGTDDNIEEFVFYANKKENGFAVIRVTGENMNPTNVMTLLSVLQKSNVKLDQLKPLEGLMQK